jgi:Na+/H+ antiporter NhaD/arsenite permease-like protein
MTTLSSIPPAPNHPPSRKVFFRSHFIPPSILRRKITTSIEELFHSLDYNLLIIFIGLFIVSGSFLQTKIPKTIWKLFAGKRPFQTGISIFVLSIYIIVASQLVGNVPVVYMAKEEVQLLSKDAQIFGWLILAWVSTVAGNFTLVGSAANIIVVEKAMR